MVPGPRAWWWTAVFYLTASAPGSSACSASTRSGSTRSTSPMADHGSSPTRLGRRPAVRRTQALAWDAPAAEDRCPTNHWVRYIFRTALRVGDRPPNNWTRVPDGRGTCACSTPSSPTSTGTTRVFDDLEDPAVLAGPRRGRLPHRRRARDGQAARAADTTITDIEMLTSQDDDPRFNHEGVHDIHRGIRSVLDDYRTRCPSERSGCSTTGLREIPAARTAHGLQLPAGAREVRRGEHPRCDRERTGGGRDRGSEPDPGRCRITTSSARSAGTGWRAWARAPAMAMVMLARRARCSSTTVKNWGCPTSSCPTRCCRIRPGSAPGVPSAAATAAGCRCRGPVRPRRSASRRIRTWLPMPPDWRRLTVERQLDDPASTLSFFATFCACAARLSFRRERCRMACVRTDRAGVRLRWGVARGEYRSSAVQLLDGEVLIASTALSGGKLPPIRRVARDALAGPGTEHVHH